MSIAVIRRVDSLGAAPPISIYEIMVFEHCSNNGFYVIRSVVMLPLSVMLVQFRSLGRSLISFLVLIIFKFYVSNDPETNQLIVFNMLFMFQPDCSYQNSMRKTLKEEKSVFSKEYIVYKQIKDKIIIF